MRNLIIVAVLLVGLVNLAGCLTEPIAAVSAGATNLIRPDMPLSAFFFYGPGSDDFNRTIDTQNGIYRSYLADFRYFVDDYDRHFLLYDKYDPMGQLPPMLGRGAD